jgi:hypothetical protein
LYPLLATYHGGVVQRGGARGSLAFGEGGEVLWKRLAVLVAAAMMMLSMFAASAPAFAQDGCVEEFPGAGSGACEVNPGQSEGSRSAHQTPPEEKPGAINRSVEANEHDTNFETGRGKRSDA